MLKSIHIKDFTLIDELSVDFDARLNILTGETGAGKSIIIDAIDAALGARASKDLIKTDKQKALIELFLEVKNEAAQSFLIEQGIDLEADGTIILSREITSSATRSRVNGVMVTQGVLQELKNFLIDIHSQHQTYKYLQSKTHIDLVDAYGGNEHQQIFLSYKKTYKELVDTKKEYERKLAENTDVEQKIEYLKFQINEIEQAEIEDIDEYEKLKAEREKMVNAQELKESAYGAYSALYGQDGSVLDALGTMEAKLIKTCQLDKDLTPLVDNLSEGSVILKDVADSLRSYADSLSYSQQRLDEVEDRMNLLEKLRRKYGATLSGVLESLEIFQKELLNIETSDEQVKILEKRVEELQIESEKLANDLSASRKSLSENLSGMVEAELKNLAMPNAKFKIGFKPKAQDSKGIDEVEFLISTNPGEGLKGLAKIASGGEISRVMLAAKATFAGDDSINTVIFDEIDTGISGPTLQSVADKMKDLSASHQIICITHNPIIAAVANKHFHVEKHQGQDSTKVQINALDYQGRLEILSKIAGAQVNESTVAFAQELLEKAGYEPKP